ncbi:MAG: BTAD domain-containing putative transcriptional regulator [Caldilineaceae bacterium]
MLAHLQLKLFGAPTITVAGEPVTGFISNKAVATIYYVGAMGQPQAREVLATLLWTNSTDTYAKKNLRNVLSNLRALVGPFIAITRDAVSLPTMSAAGVDSRRFMALLKQAEQAATESERHERLAAAVALYQGPFLDGFQLADAEAFDEWQRSEREHFGLLAIQALHELVVGSGAQGKLLEGINYATQLLKLDPLREETHRHLMQLLALDGQTSAALTQYRTCQKVLQDELGVDPDTETEQLYRRIQAGELRKAGSTPLIVIPVAAAQTPPIVLPSEITGFVGRVAEITQVQQRLAEPTCRLLTITGMGGVGKTRLALHTGHVLANRPVTAPPPTYKDGIYFMPLAALESDAQFEHQLPTAIAAQLQLPLSGATAPATQLSQALYDKDLLLILDNCEHLPIAPLLTPLLQETQHLQCLVTSRRRLNVYGEHLLRLSGLATSDEATAAGFGATGESDAVRLFVQSARAVQADFVLDRHTAPLVTKICQLLHGLPLGIELAASWVRFLSLAEIVTEIQQNLAFLDTTVGAPSDPQRSLRAVFTHSWRLLSPTEQQVLRRLAVFRAGFSRTAAMQVTGATLPLLAALSDKSLIQRSSSIADDLPQEAGSAQSHYRLHTVIHQYAAEQLAAAQETDEYAARHAAYMITWLAEQRSDLESTRQQTALHLIHGEIENVRAAWRWWIGHLTRGEVALATHTSALSQGLDSLFHFYDMRSWFQEGETVLGQMTHPLATVAATEPGLAVLDLDKTGQAAWRLQAKAQARQGWFAFHLGRYAESRRLLETSLHHLQQMQAEAETIFNLNYLGALLRPIFVCVPGRNLLHLPRHPSPTTRHAPPISSPPN